MKKFIDFILKFAGLCFILLCSLCTINIISEITNDKKKKVNNEEHNMAKLCPYIIGDYE